MGKSHCLLAVAARLWQRHLKAEGQDARLRVVYIPEWFSTTFDEVVTELVLTFSDDQPLVRALLATTTPSDVKKALKIVSERYNIVAILDQVKDTPEPGRAKVAVPSEYFQKCATVVTASSPRFDQQERLLADDSNRTEVFYVPAGLRRGEFDQFLETRGLTEQLPTQYVDRLFELSGRTPGYHG